MDQQRFDELTRALASGTSRRSALKLLGGLTAGIGAAALGSRAASAGVCAEEDEPCSVTLSAGVRATIVPECCEGLVCDVETSTCVPEGPICAAVGEACVVPRGEVDLACCEGLECVDGTCEVPVVCGEEGDACGLLNGESEAECCEGYYCGHEGLCVPVGGEVECETDDDCYAISSGDLPICCAGVCRDIECCIDDEDPNARCPEGTSCFEGICQEIDCYGEGGDCSDDYDCCGELVCYKGTCAYPVDDDDDDVDDGGADYEPVTQLPSTGVAGDGGNANLIAGAALAAGAAALLANQKLRAHGDEPAQ